MQARLRAYSFLMFLSTLSQKLAETGAENTVSQTDLRGPPDLSPPWGARARQENISIESLVSKQTIMSRRKSGKPQRPQRCSAMPDRDSMNAEANRLGVEISAAERGLLRSVEMYMTNNEKQTLIEVGFGILGIAAPLWKRSKSGILMTDHMVAKMDPLVQKAFATGLHKVHKDAFDYDNCRFRLQTIADQLERKYPRPAEATFCAETGGIYDEKETTCSYLTDNKCTAWPDRVQDPNADISSREAAILSRMWDMMVTYSAYPDSPWSTISTNDAGKTFHQLALPKQKEIARLVSSDYWDEDCTAVPFDMLRAYAPFAQGSRVGCLKGEQISGSRNDVYCDYSNLEP